MGIEAALIGGGAALLGSAMSSSAAKSAAGTQAAAADRAAQLQYDMWQQQNEQQKPYREAGYTALKDIQGLLPSLNKPFTAADLQSNLAPNYEFMKQQGLTSTGQNVNVGGGGSNVDLAKTKFAEDYASNAYQQAFANYQTQQSNVYNRLASIAGLGQSAQQSSSALAANTAANIGQAGIGSAQAQAAGTIGQAQALGGGIGQAANYYMLSNLLNQGGGTNYLGTGSSSGFGINPASTGTFGIRI